MTAKSGVKVNSLLWTLTQHDGMSSGKPGSNGRELHAAQPVADPKHIHRRSRHVANLRILCRWEILKRDCPSRSQNKTQTGGESYRSTDLRTWSATVLELLLIAIGAKRRCRRRLNRLGKSDLPGTLLSQETLRSS